MVPSEKSWVADNKRNISETTLWGHLACRLLAQQVLTRLSWKYCSNVMTDLSTELSLEALRAHHRHTDRQIDSPSVLQQRAERTGK